MAARCAQSVTATSDCPLPPPPPPQMLEHDEAKKCLLQAAKLAPKDKAVRKA